MAGFPQTGAFVSDTVTDANGQIFTISSQPTPPGSSGAVGWTVNRSADIWQANHAYAVGDQFIDGGNLYAVHTAYTSGASFGSTDTANSTNKGTNKAFVSQFITMGSADALIWQPNGLDYATRDWVPLNDPPIGDIFRVASSTTSGYDGANFIMGPGIGTPGAANRLEIRSSASDAHLQNVLLLSVYSGSSATAALNVTDGSSTLAEITAAGNASFGTLYSGVNPHGGVEVKGAVTAVVSTAPTDNPKIILRDVTGTTYAWTVFMDTASSTRRIRFTAPNGNFPLGMENGAPSNSIYLDASGNLSLGASTGQVGFFGTATHATKQAVTGALSSVTDANAKAVLTSILSALTAYNLVTNSTT